jgi:hypothetical protein
MSEVNDDTSSSAPPKSFLPPETEWVTSALRERNKVPFEKESNMCTCCNSWDGITSYLVSTIGYSCCVQYQTALDARELGMDSVCFKHPLGFLIFSQLPIVGCVVPLTTAQLIRNHGRGKDKLVLNWWRPITALACYSCTVSENFMRLSDEARNQRNGYTKSLTGPPKSEDRMNN